MQFRFAHLEYHSDVMQLCIRLCFSLCFVWNIFCTEWDPQIWFPGLPFLWTKTCQGGKYPTFAERELWEFRKIFKSLVTRRDRELVIRGKNKESNTRRCKVGLPRHFVRGNHCEVAKVLNNVSSKHPAFRECQVMLHLVRSLCQVISLSLFLLGRLIPRAWKILRVYSINRNVYASKNARSQQLENQPPAFTMAVVLEAAVPVGWKTWLRTTLKMGWPYLQGWPWFLVLLLFDHSNFLQWRVAWCRCVWYTWAVLLRMVFQTLPSFHSPLSIPHLLWSHFSFKVMLHTLRQYLHFSDTPSK